MVDMLEAKAINVSFGGLRVIKNVDMHLERAEILGLIGPNGAGKTTFVNVLSGFQKPKGGTVFLGGQDITHRRPEDRVRLGLVRTFQAVRLFGNLTVRENIEVAALALGLSRREARIRVEEAMEAMQLTEQASQQANALPYGYERRVGVARALVAQPQFILLDEPAAGLNEREGREFLQSVRDIKAMGCGVLLIEHNMRIVFDLCDRIQVLQSGETLATGDADHIRNHALVREAYLGKKVA
jgi:branched-chain amino acid transport system ATP-binding protein